MSLALRYKAHRIAMPLTYIYVTVSPKPDKLLRGRSHRHEVEVLLGSNEALVMREVGIV